MVVDIFSCMLLFNYVSIVYVDDGRMIFTAQNKQNMHTKNQSESTIDNFIHRFFNLIENQFESSIA